MAFSVRHLALSLAIVTTSLVRPVHTATSLRVFVTPLAVDAMVISDKHSTASAIPIHIKVEHDKHMARWSFLNFNVRGALRMWLGQLRASAVVLTVLLQMSPLRSVREMRQHCDVLRYDGFPYFIVMAGAIQWCLYGASAAVVTGDRAYLTMVESNGPGVLFGLFYVVMYCRYVRLGDDRRSAMLRYLSVGLAILVVEVISLICFPGKAVFWLGLLGAVVSTNVCLATFKTLPEVIKTKSTASWLTDLIVMCFVQSAVTGCFGYCISDAWIWVPNLIGVVASGIQLCIIATLWYVAGSADPHGMGKFAAGPTAAVKLVA